MAEATKGAYEPCRWGAFYTDTDREIRFPCSKAAGHRGNHVSTDGQHQWNTAVVYEDAKGDSRTTPTSAEETL
jgi:hypothetical protein